MKLPFCLMFPMLFAVTSSAEMRFNVSGFVEVILSIRKFYSAATVMFVHPGDKYGDYGDLRITHLVHTCSRMLSQHYVVTVDVHFRKIWRSLIYHRHIVQPVAVIIMPDFSSYLEFTEATRTFPMSFPVWFVLFLFSAANDTHDHCQQPLGNPFNLAFDTQMLVLCFNDEILREWYSIKGETVKIFDLARWSDEKGFILLTNLSLYDRRNDLEGTVLRAVTVKDIPISPISYTGNYVANLYGKVLDELACSLNFTLHIVSKMDEHGMWNHRNHTWSGVMGEIVSGRADFAIADMSMTSLRVYHVDFTLPLIISRNNLFIKEPGICGVKWLGYFQTFRLHAWFGIVAIIATTPLLLSFMKMCRGSRSIADLISDDFLCVWGIFCQQTLTEFPKCWSLRIAYFAIFSAAILIMAYYSAALVCFLTACTRVLPFRTIDEFVEDGTFKLIVPRGSADYDIIAATNKSFSKKLMKLMKSNELPSSIIDGFVQICNDRKLAYLVLDALKQSVERQIPCKLSAIATERIDNIGMILSKGNPYTSVINYHLQKFLDNGMMMRLKSMKLLPQSAIEGTVYQPVRVVSVVPILAILCGGVVLSVALLITEKIHRRRRERKLQSKVLSRSRKRVCHEMKKIP